MGVNIDQESTAAVKPLPYLAPYSAPYSARLYLINEKSQRSLGQGFPITLGFSAWASQPRPGGPGIWPGSDPLVQEHIPAGFDRQGGPIEAQVQGRIQGHD